MINTEIKGYDGICVIGAEFDRLDGIIEPLETESIKIRRKET